MSSSRARVRGMSLIEVLVSAALITIMFLALLGVLRASALLATQSKAQEGANIIAATQLEYLRGLTYDNLGTVGGIPAGAVAQYATTTQDGITYVTRTFIDYYDDPADGTGVADTNGITTDYKRAKISVTYAIGGKSETITNGSTFAPPGLETSNGGGTLQIDVVNAVGAPVVGANVSVVNNSTVPTINLSTITSAAGVVSLPGAATSTDYQIVASDPGYSTAQTYARAGQNVNPNPGYLTVTKNQTTTGTFAIDRLATLNLATFTPIATSTFTDTFANASSLASMSSTTVSGGSLVLTDVTGSATSIPITPSYLAGWGDVTATKTVPGGATLVVQVDDGSGNLVPDAALPGNAAGFTSFPVHLEALSTTTYPSLSLSTAMSSTGSAPSLQDWSLSYTAGPIPVPNVSLTLTGAKTIGSTAGNAPIYKTIVSTTTDATGKRSLTLEWDAYQLAVAGYDIVDASPIPPFSINPGVTMNANLYLGTQTANSILVEVNTNAGAQVVGASVSLARAGTTLYATSTSNGAAYFGGVTSASNYTLTIAKAGYTTTQFTNVSISGPTFFVAEFP